MPTLIGRDEALRRILAEGGERPCLMCALRDGSAGPRYVVAEDELAVVLLPRYVRRWGHVLVLPRQHLVSFVELEPSLWGHLGSLAHRAARMVERVMQPRRCYVASTGSSAGELAQSSAHLHVHVIPLHRADDRPADVFSWEAGLFVAEPAEWAELLDRYRSAWAAEGGR